MPDVMADVMAAADAMALSAHSPVSGCNGHPPHDAVLPAKLAAAGFQDASRWFQSDEIARRRVDPTHPTHVSSLLRLSIIVLVTGTRAIANGRGKVFARMRFCARIPR